jgi:hypothetical protein
VTTLGTARGRTLELAGACTVALDAAASAWRGSDSR